MKVDQVELENNGSEISCCHIKKRPVKIVSLTGLFTSKLTKACYTKVMMMLGNIAAGVYTAFGVYEMQVATFVFCH